jgi:hypothetical protein
MSTTGDSPLQRLPLVDVTQYALFGAVTGFALALLYTFLLFAFLMLFGPQIRLVSSVQLMGELLGTALAGFLIFAMIPSTLIGWFTGLLVGIQWNQHYPLVSNPRAVLLGLKVSTSIIFVLHVLIWMLTSGKLSFTTTVYIICLGLPSIIYMTACGSASWLLHRKARYRTAPS